MCIRDRLGGAHKDLALMKKRIKEVLLKEVAELNSKPIETLLAERYDRLMSYGKFTES